MLLIYPFFTEDYTLALENARWIAELGTVEAHQCLIVHDKLIAPEDAQAIEDALKPAFTKVARMPLRETMPGIRGMNLLFRRAARQIAHIKAGPFLWLNPDAIPIRRGWLDAIEAAYKMLPRGKVFLGHHLQGAIPFMGQIGVYPQDCEVHAPGLVGADQNPFFVNGAPGVVPKMGHTDLIVDSRDEPFTCDGSSLGATIASAKAVLWHGSNGCKSGDWIPLLRHKALRTELMEALPIIAVPAQSHQETGPQRFAVPQDPIRQDRAASLAASRAGSEGFNEPDVEIAPVIPRVKPPTVNPVVRHDEDPFPITPEIARAGAAVGAQMSKLFPPPKGIPDPNAVFVEPMTLAALPVSELAKELAKRRAVSNDGKLEVNKALREAGFTLAGQSPKKSK